MQVGTAPRAVLCAFGWVETAYRPSVSQVGLSALADPPPPRLRSCWKLVVPSLERFMVFDFMVQGS
jgi:hypothetical protein